ncbi:MAG: EF-P lysine aminoacylase EpmA [Moraxella sp.]|uniref:EF-P lysine aminoacylase EpmA n=1 Tax=Moraxella sp. TaxID=479 RepID=UPI0026DD1DAA|nr:EF-P lysine aminoacylase EpmA [Moraxella sp.]MDO4450915.1 EF-P lysine aminoacylase EpmA [Moraxella sp.]
MTDYRPSMAVDLAIARAEMLSDIRTFFASRGVLEITTPILSHHGNTDVFIQSVTANFKHAGKNNIGYLHTSPEFAMKRVLADYQMPIYQICQVFRDDEKGHKHNIEFTMLEWYRPDFSLTDLADELNALIGVVLGKNLPFKNYRYTQAFLDHINIHPFSADINTLRQTALHHGINLDMGDDKQGWLDLLFSHLIEPHLGFDLPTLITDYPVATASLAKIKIDDDGFKVANRFELYINGIEIANAYDELANGDELLKRFETDNLEREKLGLPIVPIDINLIKACDDLPNCSGIALGIDRLFMVREKLSDISEAVMFMTDRA